MLLLRQRKSIHTDNDYFHNSFQTPATYTFPEFFVVLLGVLTGFASCATGIENQLRLKEYLSNSAKNYASLRGVIEVEVVT